jgi:catechol 2,3-dioxygenase-like lactoylglutathione lyase family enzyme
MLGPIEAVTSCIPALGPTEAAYTAHLGYRTVERGRVPAPLAAAWGAPQAAGRPYILLAPGQGETVYLRFIESPAAFTFRPHTTLGWNVTEINVGGVDRIAERLRGSPFRMVGPPATLSMNDAIRAMQVIGPEGELVYLTDIAVSPKTEHLPRTAEGVGRVFIMVLGVHSIEEASDFYGRLLGADMSAVYPLSSNLINEPLGLAPDTELQLVLARLPGKFSIEIDALPPSVPRRRTLPDDLPMGPAIVSFAANELDALATRFLGTPATGEGVLYGGRRSAVIAGPAGELIELIGA